MKQENIPWDMISAWWKGEADQQQLQEIREWLKKSTEHPKILKEITTTWQLTRKETTFYEPDQEALWKKLMGRIDYQPKRKFLPNTALRWIAAAAVLAIVFLTGAWLGQSVWDKDTDMVYANVISPSGSRTKMVLPDSTTVWLNSGAELRYLASFTKRTREVFISGECFFEVTKDHKRQFIVHCNDLDVKVFGTSFNVRESRKYGQTEITLVEGKVQVLNKSSQPLATLAPEEQLVFNGERGIVKKVSNINAITAWKNNLIIFDNEPFEHVVQALESWYGVDFHVDPAVLNKHRYTFKVKTESLREVLNLISVITPINYTIEGEQVTIKYK